MFREHVWEKFCHHVSPEEGTFPRHVHQKYHFFTCFFFSNRLGVGADVSGRLGTQDDRNFRKSWKIGKFSDFSENFPQWQILQIIKF